MLTISNPSLRLAAPPPVITPRSVFLRSFGRPTGPCSLLGRCGACLKVHWIGTTVSPGQLGAFNGHRSVISDRGSPLTSVCARILRRDLCMVISRAWCWRTGRFAVDDRLQLSEPERCGSPSPINGSLQLAESSVCPFCDRALASPQRRWPRRGASRPARGRLR